MEKYLQNFKNCLEKEDPYCTAECPFHVPVLEFIRKIKNNDYKAAFRTYRNATGFPVIARALCSEPCKTVCPRGNIDSAVEIGMLEQACLEFAGDVRATDYNLPMKKEKIAIIGAGISGLACALRLTTKKYHVEIFEKSNRIGGRLYELMDPDIFLADIEKQFEHQKYILHLETEIISPDDISGFDVVYVATGKNGQDFGLLNAVNNIGEKYCARINGAGWFAGGELVGDEPIYALANGLFMGTIIDNFIKTENLLYPSNRRNTKTQIELEKIPYAKPVSPESGTSFTKEESQCEAARCVECQCNSCRMYCELTEFYNKWPLRIRDEIVATTLPGSSELKATPARRLLSTCNQCGICKEVCPESIDLGGLILAGRQSMHKQNKTPWAFHEFWLRDMEQANSDVSSLCKTPKGYEKCEYAFFPGCQLPASEPGLTANVYEALLSLKPDMGLLLKCCGVPAEWAGMEEKHKQLLDEIKVNWDSLGQPKFVLACPTCIIKFKEYLPEIPVMSLYEALDQWGYMINNSLLINDEKKYSIFDACAARHNEEIKMAVKNLVNKAKIKTEPHAGDGKYPHCCSYGGQGAVANPEYADFVAKKRIAESSNPYITYCINCRDIFMAREKEAAHILELLFWGKLRNEALPTVSDRQLNRAVLKKELLNKYWGEDVENPIVDYGFTLNIPDEVRKKLSEERILEKDIAAVIDFGRRHNRKVLNSETGTYTCYHQIGYLTYWAEFTEDERGVNLVNAYFHRIKIELEAVWNGIKQDTDLQ